ncbi:hypothetical protein LR48_Vigan07g148500 [Vigna angularis]|uniref:Uncharacterized protein n=1 Tax=Phaseolus angularis TaxID=3914 RepID=A0A0L9UYK8_PHAAN|nr:hypothetical protein LR48_Vigan07g148500 [Vigna angularis]
MTFDMPNVESLRNRCLSGTGIGIRQFFGSSSRPYSYEKMKEDIRKEMTQEITKKVRAELYDEVAEMVARQFQQRCEDYGNRPPPSPVAEHVVPPTEEFKSFVTWPRHLVDDVSDSPIGQEGSPRPKNTHLSEDDPLDALDELVKIISDALMNVHWDSTTFGREAQIPLYLHHQDVRELTSGREEINITLIQLWMICLATHMMLSGTSSATTKKLAWVALKVCFYSWECCRNRPHLKKTGAYASIEVIPEVERLVMASVIVTPEGERLAVKKKRTLLPRFTGNQGIKSYEKKLKISKTLLLRLRLDRGQIPSFYASVCTRGKK